VKDHRALKHFVDAVRLAEHALGTTSTHKPSSHVILGDVKDL
jgi:hypothetical protein